MIQDIKRHKSITLVTVWLVKHMLRVTLKPSGVFRLPTLEVRLKKAYTND